LQRPRLGADASRGAAAAAGTGPHGQSRRVRCQPSRAATYGHPWPEAGGSRRSAPATALRRGPGARRPVARVHGARRPGRHPAVPAGPMNPGRLAGQARRAAGSAGSRPSPARITMSWHSPYNGPRPCHQDPRLPCRHGSDQRRADHLGPGRPRPIPERRARAGQQIARRPTASHHATIAGCAGDPYPDHSVPLITSRNQTSPRWPKNIRRSVLQASTFRPGLRPEGMAPSGQSG